MLLILRQVVLRKITNQMHKNRQNTANAHYLYAHVKRMETFAYKNELAPNYQLKVKAAT